MDSLRIKCPSCGIVLEVRNSKHERVKRITCPNCKKQLDVNFAEEEQPVPAPSPLLIGSIYEGECRYPLVEGVNALPHVPDGLAELKVLHLAGGQLKSILRILAASTVVCLNGQPLQQDDEVVLSQGDEVEIGDTLLTYGRPGRVLAARPAPSPESPSSSPLHKSPSAKPYLFALVAFLGIGLLFWALNGSDKGSQMAVGDTDSIAEVAVEPESKLPVAQKSQPKTTQSQLPSRSSAEPSVKPSVKPVSDTSDFALETKASRGNVKAQYELGMRWITSNDCNEVRKGVQYLDAAAGNGSAAAQYALGIVYYKGSPACGISRNLDRSRRYMQQAASNGHRKAQRYLQSDNY